MKPLILAAVLAFIPGSRIEALDEPIEGVISEVLLYPGQARITRTVEVAAGEAGISEIRVGPLPIRTIDDSVQVDGSETLKVVSVQVSREAGEKVATAETIRLESEQEKLTLEVADLRMRVTASEEMLARFSKLEVSDHPEDDQKLPEIGTGAWDRFLRLVDEGIHTAAETIADIRPRLDSKERELSQISVQLNREIQNAQREFVLISLAIQDLSGDGGSVALKYRIAGANWYPEYQVDVDSSTGAIEITVHGVAIQFTGEDWKQVPVGFSTSLPERGAGLPELAALHIERPRFKELSRDEGRARYAGRPVEAERTPALKLAREDLSRLGSTWGDLPRDELIVAGLELQTESMSTYNLSTNPAFIDLPRAAQPRRIQSRGFSRIFESLRPETVLSGGSPHRLLLGVKNLTCVEERTSAPELQAQVFRRLKSTLTGEDPVIGGNAAIFLGDAYLGIAQIPTTAPGEELEVDLGTDDGVVVTRNQRDREEVIGFLSKARLLSTEVTVRVENYHDTPVTIDIRERIPFTESDLIDITLDERKTIPMPDRWNRNAGLLGWDLEVPAGEARTITLLYTLEVPLDRELTVQDAPERIGEEDSR